MTLQPRSPYFMSAAALILSHVLAVADSNQMKNSMDMVLLKIKAGSYVMGSPESEKERGNDEAEVEVSLRSDFYLAESEVTQEQWFKVMEKSLKEQIETQDGPVGRGAKLVAKASAEGPLQPMCFVSWNDAVAFCAKLTKLEKEAGRLPEGMRYALPTEAQWEYACRAGTKTVFSFGDSISSKQANFYGPSPYGGAEKGPYLEKTSEVKSYPANPWGIYDMHGNLYEWCADWYGEALPGGVDPTGVSEGESRIIRGGTWNRKGSSCRSAYRYSAYPYTRSYNIGFRVALVKES